MITAVDNAENLSKGRQCLLIREWLGLTQEDFGDLLEVSGNTVCDWESGKRVPRNGHWLDIRMLFSLRDNADLSFQLALLKRLELCPECEKKAVKAIPASRQEAFLHMCNNRARPRVYLPDTFHTLRQRKAD